MYTMKKNNAIRQFNSSYQQHDDDDQQQYQSYFVESGLDRSCCTDPQSQPVILAQLTVSQD